VSQYMGPALMRLTGLYRPAKGVQQTGVGPHQFSQQAVAGNAEVVTWEKGRTHTEPHSAGSEAAPMAEAR
jgi:hypothetical protein